MRTKRFYLPAHLEALLGGSSISNLYKQNMLSCAVMRAGFHETASELESNDCASRALEEDCRNGSFKPGLQRLPCPWSRHFHF